MRDSAVSVPARAARLVQSAAEMNEKMIKKNESNSTDATTGQSLRARVEQRKAEIIAAIAKPETEARVKGELQNALSEVEGLLTGDLDRIPKVVAAELMIWLDASKHLDEHHPSNHRRS